jgi:hypothetical protein
MKTPERIADQSRAGVAGMEAVWRLSLIGAALALASSMLVAGNANTSQTGAPPTPLNASTEGIGSLPMVVAPDLDAPYGDPYGGLIPGRLRGPEDLLRPFLVLQGTLTDLGAVVSDAEGSGLVSLVHAPKPDGGWILGFHGDVEVDVDPLRAPYRSVDIGFRVGDEFAGGLAVLRVDGAYSPIIKLVDTTLAVSLNELHELAFNHEGGIDVYLISLFGTRAQFRFALHDGVISVLQALR